MMSKLIGLVGFMALSTLAQDVSPERLKAHVRFLASDLLEGRGTGQRGGEIATEYLAAQLAVAGARPAGENGGWFQSVPLVGVRTKPNSRLVATLAGKSAEFAWLTEWVGQAQTQKPGESVDTEAIFVGHGITAPEYGWDDYGSTDVKGKLVVLFTNEPPSDDPAFFEGKALTYYGRWTYKYEEALRRGARAALILHTNETAGYGWDVVKNSWGSEDASVKVEGPALAFAGWLSQSASAKFLELAGLDPVGLLAKANRKGFRPIPLKIRVKATVESQVREMQVRNVLGRIEGSDPALRDQVIMYTAHWDHLGKTGDEIFNGAVDNATGCSVLLEIARAWNAFDPKPRRSVMFLFTAGEEAGLRGAEYYVAHPLVPLAKTALVLNFDSYFPFGATRDVSLLGAERSTFFPQVQSVARRLQLDIAPDPRPEQGSFFRSDHFPFAQAKVVAFSVESGKTFVTDSPRKEKLLDEYNDKHYHNTTDDFHETWDVASMEQMTRFGIALGQEAANVGKMPGWSTKRK